MMGMKRKSKKAVSRCRPPCPFQDATDRVGEQEIWLKKMDKKARAVVADPLKYYGMVPDGRVAQLCRKVCDESQYVVQCLAKVDGVWREREVRALTFSEFEPMGWYWIEVDGWVDALRKVMRYMAETRRDVVRQLDECRLLPWVRKTSARKKMSDCWRQGDFDLCIEGEDSASRLVQWLFMICGISLISVAACYDSEDARECRGVQGRSAGRRCEHFRQMV